MQNNFLSFLMLHELYADLQCLVAEFRSGKSPILVATDVAARGLGRFVSFICDTLYLLL
jgi:hypothetical protein